MDKTTKKTATKGSKTTKLVKGKVLQRGAKGRIVNTDIPSSRKSKTVTTLPVSAITSAAGTVTLVRRPSIKERLKYGINKLRLMTGVFMASASPDYRSSWLRDQLYCALHHYYMGEFREFEDSVRVVFRRLHAENPRLQSALKKKPIHGYEFLHAKHCPASLDDETDSWGHHQVDAIGLFLYVVATHQGKDGINFFRDDEMEPGLTEAFCRQLLQDLVKYLEVVRYWAEGDFGMWEEPANGDGIPHWHPARNHPVLHASSVAAAVAGLLALREAKLAEVPDWLITDGAMTLQAILPNEIYVDQNAYRYADMAQLSIVWPYGEILTRHGVITKEMTDTILERVKATLVQEHGLNRYWGDEFGGRSPKGVSGEWPLGFEWLAIICATEGDLDEASYWHKKGIDTMSLTKSGDMTEMFVNGKPALHHVGGRWEHGHLVGGRHVEHTPLTWAHSFALIAHTMIAQMSKKQ